MSARRPSKTRLEPAGGAHGGLTERGKARAAVSAAVRGTLAWMRSPAGAVLVLLVLQSTSIVLLMRHSKTMVRAPGTGPAYPSSVAIFLAELLKMPLCLGMAAWTMHGHGGLAALLREEVAGRPWHTLRMGVPALAYTVQGNLLFVALAHLEAPTYQVLAQGKTLFTALFSWLIIGRQLRASQWVALLLLVLGASAAGLGSSGVKLRLPSLLARAEEDDGAPEQVEVAHLHRGSSAVQVEVAHLHRGSSAVGLVAVLGAGMLSASASVYFEKILKSQLESQIPAGAGLWLRNIQLGLFALPLALATALWSDGPQLRAYGLLQGFDSTVVWGVVLLNSAGGLLVAATMKYADNIVKCFATAIAILAGTLLSVPLFGFEPSELFLLGAPLTVGATILYARAPERLLPAWCARARAAAAHKQRTQRSKKGEGDAAGEGGKGGEGREVGGEGAAGCGGAGGGGGGVGEERGRELAECKPGAAPLAG